MRRIVLAALVAVVACGGDRANAPYDSLPTPTGLEYQLVPSGFPDSPDGVLLKWDDVADENTSAYVVYSRSATSGPWSRRAETTSPSFHDAGYPAYAYYVATRDEAGHESVPSNSVTIDVRLHLPAPANLNSISLYRAAQLSWASNSRTADPNAFDYYRVYSTVYSATAAGCDNDLWILEGTTISEDFISTGLTNGVRYCFAVSAVSRDGHESLFSAPRDDTPRYDSRNIILDAFQVAPATSGFDFYNPTGTSHFGLVTSGSATGIDFRPDAQRRVDRALLDRSGHGSHFDRYRTARQQLQLNANLRRAWIRVRVSRRARRQRELWCSPCLARRCRLRHLRLVVPERAEQPRADRRAVNCAPP
jgi:hypothetical protein